MTVTPPAIIKWSSAMRISSPLAQTPIPLPLRMMKVMTMTMMTSHRQEPIAWVRTLRDKSYDVSFQLCPCVISYLGTFITLTCP